MLMPRLVICTSKLSWPSHLYLYSLCTCIHCLNKDMTCSDVKCACMSSYNTCGASRARKCPPVGRMRYEHKSSATASTSNRGAFTKCHQHRQAIALIRRRHPHRRPPPCQTQPRAEPQSPSSNTQLYRHRHHQSSHSSDSSTARSSTQWTPNTNRASHSPQFPPHTASSPDWTTGKTFRRGTQ